MQIDDDDADFLVQSIVNMSLTTALGRIPSSYVRALCNIKKNSDTL